MNLSFASIKALLNLSLFIFPLFASAQKYVNNSDSLGAVRGIVLTADSEPAPYVTVAIKSISKEAITDADGKFEFKKIDPGNYVLSVSLTGYIPSESGVAIKKNVTAFLEISLQLTFVELTNIHIKGKAASKYVETRTSGSLRLNLPLIEIPQNISVIGHKLLADQGAVSMTEAIHSVSGVQKSFGGLNDYSLNIRGTDASFNVFRNGIGGFYWNQQEDIDMLEKIEFIKGPAGFMTSMAEPGGIVNNVTKQPAKEQIAIIRTGFGSYNLKRLTADFGGTLYQNSKFTYRLNAGIHSQNRAFRYGSAQRYFLSAALKYAPTMKTSITAEYNNMYGKTLGNNDELPSIDGKMFALPHDFVVADASTSMLVATDKYYRLQATHKFSDSWNFNAQAAYVNGTWGGYQLGTEPEIPVTNDTLYRFAYFDDSRNQSGAAHVFVDGKFNTSSNIEHKVLLGAHYSNNGITDPNGGTWGEKRFGLYLPRPDYYINPDSLKHFNIDQKLDIKAKWIAAYLQDNIKIKGKLLVTLAAHFTHSSLSYVLNPDKPEELSSTNYNLLTPRIGLTWLFSDNISVYTLYDKCFFPQVGRSIEEKPFSPLTGYNIETGTKAYFYNEKLAVNFSLFHIVKNNTLTADPAHQGYFVQRGQITSNGIDIDMIGEITPAFTVNVNYEYADAKITKDINPHLVGLNNFGIPNHSGNLWLKYNLLKGPLKNISFAFGYHYMGKRSAAWNWTVGEPIKFLPIYNLFDAALSYRNEKFNISLNVYNVTNINFAAKGYFNANLNEWRYTPGEPLNFRLSFGINLVRMIKAGVASSE